MAKTRKDQLRTLLVEDELLVRLATEDMLAALGCTIAAAPATLEQAITCIETQELDLGVLDINLSGTAVYPAAELLRTKGVPFIFTSGYGHRGIEPQWRATPILQKPYELQQLERAIDIALAG